MTRGTRQSVDGQTRATATGLLIGAQRHRTREGRRLPTPDRRGVGELCQDRGVRTEEQSDERARSVTVLGEAATRSESGTGAQQDLVGGVGTETTMRNPRRPTISVEA